MRTVCRDGAGSAAAGGETVTAAGEALAAEGAFVSGVVVVVPESLLDWQPISRKAANKETNSPLVQRIQWVLLCIFINVFPCFRL